MKSFFRIFFSWTAIILVVLVFAFSIALATFIENDYGADAARAAVYHARWFEALVLLLGVQAAGRIVIARLWAGGKRSVLLLHASFVLVVLGYGMTRYAGVEGTFSIREGDSSGTFLSDRAYLIVRSGDGEGGILLQKPLLLSPIGWNRFSETFMLQGQRVTVFQRAFYPNTERSVVEAPGDPDAGPIAVLSLSTQAGSETLILRPGEELHAEGTLFGFESETPDSLPGVRLQRKGNLLFWSSNREARVFSMSDRTTVPVRAGKESVLQTMTLVSIGGMRFALKSYTPEGKILAKASASNPADDEEEPESALVVGIRSGDRQTEVSLFGGSGREGEPGMVSVNGLPMRLEYGSKRIPLPFEIKLLDFEVGRYPGSMKPSSFSSDVVVDDAERNLSKPFRIYMNHILRYRGYRFYQSSYDEDEKGSVLSVSRDPGTPMTYAGYVLLAAGLVAMLFRSRGRFRILGKKAASIGLVLLFGLVLGILCVPPGPVRAQTYQSGPATDLDLRDVDGRHADAFALLPVQDDQGRVKPVYSLVEEILRKVAGSRRPDGLSVGRIGLGLWLDPQRWKTVPLVPVENKGLKSLLGLGTGSSAAAFQDFFDPRTGASKLAALAGQGRMGIPDPDQDRRMNQEKKRLEAAVATLERVFSGRVFRFFPVPENPARPWVDPSQTLRSLPPDVADIMTRLVRSYRDSLTVSMRQNDSRPADQALAEIRDYQTGNGASLVPRSGMLKCEVLYNRIRIFGNLAYLYMAAGLGLLFLIFGRLASGRIRLDRIGKGLVVAVGVGLFFHTSGLALRWIIGGHAPWTNKYESMVFIAWASALAGILFSRKNLLPPAAAALLSCLILLLAGKGGMDPRITTLAPVLRSHWLVIHVSVITTSYGFFGVGAFMGFLTLLAMVFKSKSRSKVFENFILKETWTGERMVWIGLVLLALGNGLGAVWANESWGRYWGWDPKETWTLVTILIYASLLHSRFHPKAAGPWPWNVFVVLAFGSVLMTYFGVNVYLSGLHSYAQGDPVPLPDSVIVSVILWAAVSILAFRKKKMEIVSPD